MNECREDRLALQHSKYVHNCHEDANCTNTNGSFYCTCLHGYSGDGITCAGKQNAFQKVRLQLCFTIKQVCGIRFSISVFPDISGQFFTRVHRPRQMPSDRSSHMFKHDRIESLVVPLVSRIILNIIEIFQVEGQGKVTTSNCRL